MKISSFKINNFKSIQSIIIYLDEKFSVLTGANNSGKTTILEALSLWVECFEKLIYRTKKGYKDRYNTGDYVLGVSSNKYFDFENLDSVHCPNIEDIFYNRDIRNKILLSATLYSSERHESIEIPFVLSVASSSRYVIQLYNVDEFDYTLFNAMFRHLPSAVASYFASPVACIDRREDFMTTPVMNDYIRQRKSSQVLRNRIYNLMAFPSIFKQFQQDLSYILFNSASANILFNGVTDINKDKRAIITYNSGEYNVEKDVALLGSGSLQIIEILLDLYHNIDDKKDLNLVLLDEPDSHIHRDIQQRLVSVLMKVNNNQLVVTSHNESLIRSTPLNNLFHITGNGKGEIKCTYSKDLPKLAEPHFKGLYPSLSTPIIKDVHSESSGLDFISAIEADKIVFVEGDDDARLLHRIFYQNIANKNKKVMFWVLGGISKIYDKIDAYRIFFSEIKNSRTLWEKSVLVFDRDSMIDSHLDAFVEKLRTRYNLSSFTIRDCYTQESVLLSNVTILANLLILKYDLDVLNIDLEKALSDSLESYSEKVRTDYLNVTDSDIQRYKGQYINKLNEKFEANIKTSGDISFMEELRKYYQNCPITALCTKKDVELIINGAFAKLSVDKRYEENSFYEVASCMGNGLMYDAWLQLSDFLSE